MAALTGPLLLPKRLYQQVTVGTRLFLPKTQVIQRHNQAPPLTQTTPSAQRAQNESKLANIQQTSASDRGAQITPNGTQLAIYRKVSGRQAVAPTSCRPTHMFGPLAWVLPMTWRLESDTWVIMSSRCCGTPAGSTDTFDLARLGLKRVAAADSGSRNPTLDS